MPTDPKPLFRPEAVRPKLRAFAPPPHADRAKAAKWAKMLAGAGALKFKETEVRDEFLYDLFRDALGYVTVSQNPADYSFKKEQFVQADKTYADAGFGRFGGPAEVPLIVLEGKGPNDPLDRPYAGRKRSAFEQALLYAINLGVDWYIVTNLAETRLYCKQRDQFTFERFLTRNLAADEAEWKRFVYLLGAERVLAPGGNHLTALLGESARIGRELTDEFYREYRRLRERTFHALREHNPTRGPAALLTATQKLLDRVLFVAFCEDRGLLPRESIARAYTHADPYHPRPVWQNFVGLFQAVDRGRPELGISQYNGGLYAPDDFLDTLLVPDGVCEGFKKLAEYEYGNAADTDAKLIDVEILGHVFEQSITDLQELHRSIDPAAPPAEAAEAAEPSRRKKEGAFYTPAFVTRYILAETLGAVVRDRFAAYRARCVAGLAKKAARLLDDPTNVAAAGKTGVTREALVKFWAGWLKELETVRVVDPSCGSGAFLIEAFDQMFAQYETAEGYLTALGAGSGLFETRKTILTNNIFGMDLNSEAVEIARLSSWIKTAEVGKTLTTLDANVVQGNSVAPKSSSPLEAWRAAFPAAFNDGGFDVVVGNPPYVRQEWITADKEYLQRHYKAFNGVADLYVYFYELGLNILKPGGRLGFIVTNKWMKAGYGENLRKLYGEAAWVEQVVDFGHAKQIFPDADVFPCIVVAQKPTAGPPPADTQVCSFPRETLKIDDLSRQIKTKGVSVPRSRFGAGPWNLEPPGVSALIAKVKANGVPLKEFAGCSPLYGIKTGFNDAFVIDEATKDRLIGEDPRSAEVIKKYLRGQDIDRWQAEWAGEWMIFARRGIDIDHYPAVKRHLEGFRAGLEPKPRDWDASQPWPGRKGGSYKWYELQDPVDYWQAFERPKIGYQVIQFHPCYALDRSGVYGNDKTFFIPNADLYLLAVLNSPLMWWHNWRVLVHLKDEALSPMGYLVEAFPIARPSAEARAEVEGIVAQLIDLTGSQTAGVRAVLQWLRAEFGVGKPSQKLAGLAGLSAADFLAEVKKHRGRGQPLTVGDVKRLTDAYAESVLPLHAAARAADRLERRASDLVNAAYGLTPDDVRLLWETAPPRMPFQPQ